MPDKPCNNHPVIEILSIQSAVAYGFAGNSAAVFPLRRLGLDVWPVLTVNFSNHTGYASTRGPHIPASDVAEVVRGIDERGVLARVAAVLSGYQGSVEVGTAILNAVALTKSRNPAAIYCADPVFGDSGRGFFAAPGIPEFMRDNVVPQADIMSPNLFELEFLTGRSTSTIAEVVAAAEALRAAGPETVLVTSVVGQDADDKVMRMVAINGAERWQVVTPMIDRAFVGSGDLTTAMFLAQLLKGASLGDALGATASIVYSILKLTADLQMDELALVQAQNNIVDPEHVFIAEPLTV